MVGVVVSSSTHERCPLVSAATDGLLGAGVLHHGSSAGVRRQAAPRTPHEVVNRPLLQVIKVLLVLKSEINIKAL